MADSHYIAYLQMPVVLHGDKSEIVEAEIRLPVWYHPQPGHFMVHDLTDGLMPLGPVFFDGKRDTIVLTTVGSAYDFTTTLDEWLMDRPQWHKAAHPFIVQEKQDESKDR